MVSETTTISVKATNASSDRPTPIQIAARVPTSTRAPQAASAVNGQIMHSTHSNCLMSAHVAFGGLCFGARIISRR